MTIVKATNKIALVSVIALVYWVFIFLSTTVFGFKVFQENMTELFFMSIFGLFAVLFGAIILNIMFNLTAIAEARETAVTPTINKSKWSSIFVGSLIAIFALLYAGDSFTTQKKKSDLVGAAKALVAEQSDIIERLSEYSFSKEYLLRTKEDILLLSRVEEKFPTVTVIVQDQIKGKPYLLGFNGYYHNHETKTPLRADHILSTSEHERQYLYRALNGETTDHYFSAHNGHHELYYPVTTDKGTIVLYLSKRNRYGKFGS